MEELKVAIYRNNRVVDTGNQAPDVKITSVVIVSDPFLATF